MSALVSIVIPTRNRAGSYLEETLRSALGQTYDDLEVVVSDNCSSDHTEELVRRYQDPRLRYIKRTALISHVDHYNFCLQQARGDYFLLLHDDDLIDRDFVETCLDAVNNRLVNIGIIRTGLRWVDKDCRLLKELPNEAGGLPNHEFFKAYFNGKAGIYLCSTLFNTKRLAELGGFCPKNRGLGDVMAIAKLAVKFGRKDIREMKASNRKHGGEMTLSQNVAFWCDEALELIALMCELTGKDCVAFKEEALRAQASYSYQLADKIRSTPKRWMSYWNVYRKFERRYLPPPVRQVVDHSPLFNWLRGLKKLVQTG